MEARRFLIVAGLAAVLLAAFAPQAGAYLPYLNDKGAHPWINQAAVEKFQAEIMPYDTNLKNATFTDDAFYGMSWPDGQTSKLTTPEFVQYQRSMKDWITFGGFMADEPEAFQALRHFYDPTNKATPYLTDQVWITDYLSAISSIHGNPQISAKAWAFEDQSALDSDKADLFPQDFSFEDAKRYYEGAMADADPNNVNYGKAWIAVGETMHLISDMTVPAHVRNDGHLWTDGYEDAVNKKDVGAYKDYEPASAINYGDKDIRNVFEQTAKFTNANFFSDDTMPTGKKDAGGMAVTANGKAEYGSPGLAGLTPDSNGYYVVKINGRDTRIARVGFWGRWGITQSPNLYLDRFCLMDEKAILIPTAVRSSEAVLDCFLPRFQVTAKVAAVVGSEDKYTVDGKIDHLITKEWPQQDLTIGNGAFVIVTDSSGKQMSKTAIKPESGRSLNRFTAEVTASQGDIIRVEYNLGGYVVYADATAPAAKKQEPHEPMRDFPDLPLPPAPQPLKQHQPSDTDHSSYSYYVDSNGVRNRWGPFKSYFSNGQVSLEGTVIIDANTGFERYLGYWRQYNQDGSLLMAAYYDANGVSRFVDSYDYLGNPVTKVDYSEGDVLSREWLYVKAKLQAYEEFDAAGKMTLKETYDENGKLIDSQKN